MQLGQEAAREITQCTASLEYKGSDANPFAYVDKDAEELETNEVVIDEELRRRRRLVR